MIWELQKTEKGLFEHALDDEDLDIERPAATEEGDVFDIEEEPVEAEPDAPDFVEELVLTQPPVHRFWCACKRGSGDTTYVAEEIVGTCCSSETINPSSGFCSWRLYTVDDKS